MKTKLAVGAVMTLSLSSAYAQSSVTLFGVVDAGIAFTSNAAGAHQYAEVSGANGANRWGLTGSEDLGGGLKAIFTVEDGFLINSGKMGTNGTEFGRQAFVGLSNPYGTLTLGRQYSATYMAVGPLSAGGYWAAIGAGYGTHPGDVDNLDSSNRIANAIKYQSPMYRGLQVTTLYSLGGVSGDFTRNEIIDVATTYTNGSVTLAAGYLLAKDPNFSFWGNKANDSTTGVNIVSPVNSGYASAGSQQIIGAGGNYVFGSATVGLLYTNTQFKNLGSVEVAGLNAAEKHYTGSAIFNTGEVNFRYQLSPALLLGAAYTYMKNSGAGDLGSAHYQQADVGAIYSLSRSTSLYAFGIYQRAAGTDSTGAAAVAAITAATPSSNNHQIVATVGMTHTF
ncbi:MULTISPECIES: porin [unclassified Caballeronia]|jgi:predicted porin|uniref:porin n=1 Tax=unclassified Caballeronia TaxID=2646786 RepID=UPI003ECF2C2E